VSDAQASIQEYRGVREALEKAVLPLAISVDGRRFGFQTTLQIDARLMRAETRSRCPETANPAFCRDFGSSGARYVRSSDARVVQEYRLAA
jgi:hypothetical protein